MEYGLPSAGNWCLRAFTYEQSFSSREIFVFKKHCLLRYDKNVIVKVIDLGIISELVWSRQNSNNGSTKLSLIFSRLSPLLDKRSQYLKNMMYVATSLSLMGSVLRVWKHHVIFSFLARKICRIINCLIMVLMLLPLNVRAMILASLSLTVKS